MLLALADFYVKIAKIKYLKKVYEFKNLRVKLEIIFLCKFSLLSENLYARTELNYFINHFRHLIKT